MNSKKIYFASDFHLGAGGSQQRERLIIGWLDRIATEAEAIYLVGDLFDFWFEYKYVVPKGFVRFLGKLAELVDQGVEIHVFRGNHDMWMNGYLEEEVGVILHDKPIYVHYYGKKILVGHGDGLGPGDHGYKLLKGVFSNKMCQWLFARLHPNFAFGLASFFSGLSRSHTEEESFLGSEREWLILYAEEVLKQGGEVPDYFIFGHRHLPIDYVLSNGHSRYVNLGEWFNHCMYAVLGVNGSLSLECADPERDIVVTRGRYANERGTSSGG